MEFFAPGLPAPQGSKNPWGQEMSKNLRPWREAVIIAARNAVPQEVYFGAVQVFLHFRFPRPKSHFGSGRNAALLKATAPNYKTSTPDLDKLIRAVLDALTQAGVWKDDSLVAKVYADKRYDDEPGVNVTISSL